MIKVYHCQTFDDSCAFLNECAKKGLTWEKDVPAVNGKLAWYDYKEDTCYIINGGIEVSFISSYYVTNNNYEIIIYKKPKSIEQISYDDFKKLDIGDKVLLKTFEELAKEYPVKNHVIMADYKLTNEDRAFLGKIVTIEDIDRFCDIFTFSIDGNKQTLSHEFIKRKSNVEDRPGICPICGSNEIHINNIIDNGAEGFNRVWLCKKCRATGKETYTFTGHDEVNKSKLK